MGIYFIAGFILVGLLLVILEIFVLPGFIAGIIGGLMILYGITHVYFNYGLQAALFVFLGLIVLFVLLMYLFFQSKTWKKVSLNNSIDSKVNVINKDEIKVGDVGVSISRLAPIGTALINDNYYEVCSLGEFIKENTQIEVVKIEHNKIYVKEKNA